MATPVQSNLESASIAYSSNFTQGDLALPPAKKYLVRTSPERLSTPAQLSH